MIILKFTLLEKGDAAPGDRYVSMPSGAKVLSIQEQDGEVKIWAAVSEEAVLGLYDTYVFHVMWTGQAFYEHKVGDYITTLLLKEVAPGVVVHIFDKRERY